MAYEIFAMYKNFKIKYLVLYFFVGQLMENIKNKINVNPQQFVKIKKMCRLFYVENV